MGNISRFFIDRYACSMHLGSLQVRLDTRFEAGMKTREHVWIDTD